MMQHAFSEAWFSFLVQHTGFPSHYLAHKKIPRLFQVFTGPPKLYFQDSVNVKL